MFTLPPNLTTSGTQGTVGQTFVDLSPWVSQCGTDAATFARAYNLPGVIVTTDDLIKAGWRGTNMGGGSTSWSAPMKCCDALKLDTCSIDDKEPEIRSTTPVAPTTSPRRPRLTYAQPKPTQSWTDWFWGLFGY